MTDYRATPEQWQRVENRLPGTNEQHLCALACTVRELRAWVEALTLALKDEAECNTACVRNITERLKRLEANSKPTSNLSQIRSSLVERVSCAIDRSICPDQWLHQDAARAAIREVAAWLGDQSTPGTPQWIAAADLIEELERCA